MQEIINNLLKIRIMTEYSRLQSVVEVAVNEGLELETDVIKQRMLAEWDKVMKRVLGRTGQPHAGQDGIVSLYAIARVLWAIGEDAPEVPEEAFKWSSYAADNTMNNFCSRFGATTVNLEILEAHLGLKIGKLEGNPDKRVNGVKEMLESAAAHVPHITLRYADTAHQAAGKLSLATDICYLKDAPADTSRTEAFNKMREKFDREFAKKDIHKTAVHNAVLARVIRLLGHEVA